MTDEIILKAQEVGLENLWSRLVKTILDREADEVVVDRFYIEQLTNFTDFVQSPTCKLINKHKFLFLGVNIWID